MNLSPEKLARFERLYLEQQDYYWRDKPYPQELEDDPELWDQFMEWRVEYKDAPLQEEAVRVAREHWAKEEKAKEAHEERRADESQQA